MTRDLDPAAFEPLGPEQWTDHAGAAPWGDFDLHADGPGNPPAVVERARWLGTAGRVTLESGDPNDPNAWADPNAVSVQYLHGDLVKSTNPITLQHLGWRWYQPDIGRFVQRDPIGIDDDRTAYAYVANDPLMHVDESGELE